MLAATCNMQLGGQKQRAEGSSYANWMTLQNGKMAKFCKDFVHLEFLYNM